MTLFVPSLQKCLGSPKCPPFVAGKMLHLQGGNSFSASAISSTTGVGGSSQDGLALTERQVTRLMEDDMGVSNAVFAKQRPMSHAHLFSLCYINDK